jgi:hypothetical protein
MSVARVRIAPVERWCHEGQNYVARNPQVGLIAGQEVEIDTASMSFGFCDGIKSRDWRLSDESDAKLDAIVGDHHHGARLCEHMLEMD